MSTIKASNIQPQSDSDPLVLSTNAAERMRIDTSGNVGIGTTPTSYKLTVGGSSPQFSVIDSGANLSRALITVTPNGVSFGNTYISTAIPLGFNIGVTEVARFDTSGNFGIGTTSLTGIGKLVVEQSGGNRGIIVQNGTNPHMITTDGTVISKLQTMTGVRGHVGCESNHSFSIITNNTEKLTVTNSGLVGIGTTDPTSALQVVGGVSVSGGITAGSFSAGNIAPLPTSSSGVGQIAHINTATAGTYTLPSGGTWFYFAFRWNTTSVQDSVSGIAAGGTLICSSFTGQAWEGFAWRIT